jgi:hypothetical protein
VWRLLLLLPLLAPPVCGARELLQLFVTAPYLELHTGPGRGYPVFHVVPRDGAIDVVKRRTDWFKVRTERGIEGWAAQRDMLQTVTADGSKFTFSLGDRAGFTSHRGEMGFSTGDYSGATLISAYGAYSFNPILSAELSVGQFLGNAANGTVADIGLTHTFLPEWRISPFAMLGTGILNIEPKGTLVSPVDRTDQTAYVGGGVRFYLTRRFFLRAEYKNHVVFTSRDDNDKVNEWKLGFAFFF